MTNQINLLWTQYNSLTGKGSLKVKAELIAKIRELTKQNSETL